MRIGILTITPTVGFGGLLQAYALQQTLNTLTGSEVEIINYKPKISIRQHLSYFISSVIKKVCKQEFVKYTINSEYSYRIQNLRSFHKYCLKYSPIVHPGISFSRLANSRYDVIVVGSDQVWRPKYVLSIKDFFLENVSSKIKKISYAASLGVDDWEFNIQDTQDCSRLINSFDYVSVREKEAKVLIEKNLNYNKNIYWDLDPTLLANSSIYNELLIPSSRHKPHIFSYILDKSNDKSNIQNLISNYLNKDVFDFNTGGEDSSQSLNNRVAPPIEEWVSGIYNSDFVITDSFHGCVFSIIFNKPFVAYVNKERGANRFISLLSMLNLEKQMIYSYEDFDQSLLTNIINWKRVNEIIEEQRAMILHKLKTILSKED